MIIGTAGHIDHGKSALIEALTGARMDRLQEERRRGITIELNFAPFDLGDGRVAGMVDVPGHEDFVRTMVAGASGMDLLLLVVAADEGIMPQTLEHLAVAEQLGIPRGIPILTKSDLVEADWLDLVQLELVERLARSPIRFDQPAVVSSRTGTGIAELRDRIRSAAEESTPRTASDLFRLPVDRAFSLAGVGTVVTGTTWSGTLALGDTVRFLPSGREARVRSIETHGRQVERAEAGCRTAVGLAGVDRDQVHRGDMLVTAGDAWVATTALDVMLRLLPEAPRPLVSRSRVHLHLGTAEVLARVYPRGKIEPGEEGFARVALEQPLASRGGDRFVLRSYSPVTTIAGGRVLDPEPSRRIAVWPAALASAEPGERLGALLRRRVNGIPAAALPILLGSPLEKTDGLAQAPGIRRMGEWLVSDARVAGLSRRIGEVVAEYQRSHPSDPGMPLASLRQLLRAPEWLVEGALGDLLRAGTVARVGGVVHLSGFQPTVAGGAAQIDRLVQAVTEAGLTPPTVAELAAATGMPEAAAALRLAAREGRLIAVERDRYYAPAALARLEKAFHAIAAEGEITPAALRQSLGLTRKFLIPLLEWADAQGITERVGEGRRLVPNRAG